MINRHAHEIECSSCRLSEYCFPLGFSDSELKYFDGIVDRKKIYQKNNTIYKENDSFSKILVIRSGCAKTYVVNKEGDIEISGFCYPGELLGLSAIHSKKYQESAQALDTLSVCSLDFKELENIAKKVPSIQTQLIKLMSEKLSSNLKPSLNSSAESRVASLLLNISLRMKRYGTSPVDFTLSMSRQDISNYLGIRIETVSRIFSKFQRDNLLENFNKRVVLKDLRALQILSCNNHN